MFVRSFYLEVDVVELGRVIRILDLKASARAVMQLGHQFTGNVPLINKPFLQQFLRMLSGLSFDNMEHLSDSRWMVQCSLQGPRTGVSFPR